MTYCIFSSNIQNPECTAEWLNFRGKQDIKEYISQVWSDLFMLHKMTVVALKSFYLWLPKYWSNSLSSTLHGRWKKKTAYAYKFKTYKSSSKETKVTACQLNLMLLDSWNCPAK